MSKPKKQSKRVLRKDSKKRKAKKKTKPKIKPKHRVLEEKVNQRDRENTAKSRIEKSIDEKPGYKKIVRITKKKWWKRKFKRKK